MSDSDHDENFTFPDDPAEAIETLRAWLRSGDPANRMLEDALRCKLRPGQFRSLCWKYFLGLIPPPQSLHGVADEDEKEERIEAFTASWRSHLTRLRTRYTEIRKLKIPQPAAAGTEKTSSAADEAAKKPAAKPSAVASRSKKPASGPRFGDESSSSSSSGEDDDVADPIAADATHDNPLSASPEGVWAQYFQHQKAMELVDKDLGRLWGGDPFFEKESSKADLRCVLETLVASGVCEYRQGVHEVASLIYLSNTRDADVALNIPVSDPLCEAARVACSRRHLCEDTFAMLAAVLFNGPQLVQFGFPESTTSGFGLGAWYDADEAESGADCVSMATVVQSALLEAQNPKLAKHIASMDVQPVLYGLRWLRLLFIREFYINQAAQLWDAIFAEFALDRQPVWRSCVPHLAVAMLSFIGSTLLEMDDSGMLLRRLMRYPPVEDVSAIVRAAIHAHHGPDGRVAALADVVVLPNSSFPNAASVALSGHQAAADVDPRGNWGGGEAFDTRQSADIGAASLPRSAERQLDDMAARDRRLATDLDAAIKSIMSTLQRPSADPSDNAASSVGSGDASVDLAMAVSQLKRIRDELRGDL